MKVVEDRSMQGDFPIRWDCRACKSTIEADDPQDVKVGWFGANWGGESKEKELYVECPVCGDSKVLDWELRARVPIARRRELGFR